MLLDLTKSDVAKVKRNIEKIIHNNLEKKQPITSAAAKQAEKIHNLFGKISGKAEEKIEATKSEFNQLASIINGLNPWFRKNPISPRTKLLRQLKVIPKKAWIGGNQYGPASSNSKARHILDDEWIGHNQYAKTKKTKKNPSKTDKFQDDLLATYLIEKDRLKKWATTFAKSKEIQHVYEKQFGEKPIHLNDAIHEIARVNALRLLRGKSLLFDNPLKLKRCVKAIKRKSPGVNASAVCKASTARKTKKKSH